MCAARRRGLKTQRGPTIGQDFKAFGRLRRKVRSSGADCFFFGGVTFFHAPQAFNAASRARRKLKLFGGDGVAERAFTENLRRRERRRVWITNPTVPRRSYPATGRKFFADFKAKHGRYPEPYAIYGYEIMALVLDSIARAGDAGGPPEAGRAAIVDAFFTTEDRASVLGTYSIDNHGDTTLADYGVFRAPRGRVVFDRVVRTPASTAAAKSRVHDAAASS